MAPTPFLETERLALFEIEDDDAPFFVELDSDPEVTRYINGGLPTTLAQARAAVERVQMIRATQSGQGLWRAALRASGESVGWFMLKELQALNAPEVGYRLFRAHWGRGYATEGARALIRYGFDVLTLPTIVGVTDPDNQASQSVLRKCGLVPTGRTHLEGREVCTFERHRESD